MTDDPSKDSGLSLTRQECSHCGAIWINGKHYWSGTGNSTDNDKSELDLAGLVCNTRYGNPSKCINPKRGLPGGDTWKDRLSHLEENGPSLS